MPNITNCGAQNGDGGEVWPDKMTDAAVRWLLTHDPKAWSDMIGICFIAKKNLFIPDSSSDKSLFGSTRDFIQDFLKGFLVPFESATPEKIRAAAVQGEFKHIGRRCRLAMIDELRFRTAEKRSANVYSIDESIPSTEELTYANALEDRPARSGEPNLVNVWAVSKIALERAEGLEKMLGPGAPAVLATIAKAIADEKNPVVALATARNVSQRQARRDIVKFKQALTRALKGGDPIARELWAVLAGANGSWGSYARPEEVPKSKRKGSRNSTATN